MRQLELTAHLLPHPSPNDGFRVEADHWPKSIGFGRPLIDGHDPDALGLWLARYELKETADAEAVVITVKVHEGRQVDSPVRYSFTVKAEVAGRSLVQKEAGAHDVARRAAWKKDQDEKAAAKPVRRDRFDRPRKSDGHGW